MMVGDGPHGLTPGTSGGSEESMHTFDVTRLDTPVMLPDPAL